MTGETWQVCPVCRGVGTVPCGFYTGVSQTNTTPERCRTCGGHTIIVRPASESIDLERPDV